MGRGWLRTRDSPGHKAQQGVIDNSSRLAVPLQRILYRKRETIAQRGECERSLTTRASGSKRAAPREEKNERWYDMGVRS